MKYYYIYIYVYIYMYIYICIYIYIYSMSMAQAHYNAEHVFQNEAHLTGKTAAPWVNWSLMCQETLKHSFRIPVQNLPHSAVV